MRQILVEVREQTQFLSELKVLKDTYETGSFRTILFHFYSGVHDRNFLVSIAKEVKQQFPDAWIAGTLSAGEIMAGRLMETGVLMSAMLFEKTEIQMIRFTDVENHEEETGMKICEALDEIPEVKALEILLPGTRFNTWQMFETLSQCASSIQVFGGYAGGHDLENDDHFVFDETGVYDDAVFAIIYFGKEFYIQADKSVGWQTLGRPFKVTKADGNRLIEINGAPAVEVYEKYLKIDRHSGNFAEETFEFPLILHVDGDELLRHTMAVEKDGTLLLAGYVTEGMDVYLCFGNPSMIVKKVNKRLEEVRRFQPEAILLYSCSVRKTFWESFVDMEMEPFEKLAVTAGFHTWGEVKRNQDSKKVLEYNITLLSIAMREGEAKTPSLSEIYVDDSVLKGQASLIKRLSQLVASTTEELQNAYDHMLEMNDKLLEMTEHDALTGIFNRRKIESLIADELNQSFHTNIPVSLIMIDIDHFKAINDTYGHAIGDEALKQVSRLMWDAVDNVKCAAAGRWGGEEFFILLPHVDKKEAFLFAENLRKQIANSHFPEVHHLTVSMGVITAIGSGNRNDLFTRVDDALYKAKSSGRNRVVQCEEEDARFGFG